MYNKLNTKVNNLENNIPVATTLIHINQYNTDKQIFRKTPEDIDKKVPDTSSLVTTTVFLIQNLKKLKIEFLMLVV